MEDAAKANTTHLVQTTTGSDKAMWHERVSNTPRDAQQDLRSFFFDEKRPRKSQKSCNTQHSLRSPNSLHVPEVVRHHLGCRRRGTICGRAAPSLQQGEGESPCSGASHEGAPPAQPAEHGGLPGSDLALAAASEAKNCRDSSDHRQTLLPTDTLRDDGHENQVIGHIGR